MSAAVMPALEACLEDFEARLDAAEEERLIDQWQDFAHGRFKGDIFSPRRTPRPPKFEWPKILINDALTDYELMARRELNSASKRLTDGSGALLSARSNYGVGILPSVFGAPPFIMEDAQDCLPNVRPLPGGKEGIKKLLAGPEPDLRAGYGERVFEMGQYFRRLVAPYPKLSKYLFYDHPDLQGPFDVCELLWGSDIFVDLYDEPEMVKELLELITRTYARFMREWNRLMPHPERLGDCFVQISGAVYVGQLIIREDSGMNLSPEMFAEFSATYDKVLFEEFGGGIHYCGRGDHYLHHVCALPRMTSVNLSQPHLNDMEKIFSLTVDQGINLWWLDRPTAEAALQRGRSLHGRVHCG